MLNAWALSVLWGWFVVPLGVNALTVAHAFGISVVAQVLVRRQTDESENKKDFAEKVIEAPLFPLLALLFGYIAVGFM